MKNNLYNPMMPANNFRAGMTHATVDVDQIIGNALTTASDFLGGLWDSAMGFAGLNVDTHKLESLSDLTKRSPVQ